MRLSNIVVISTALAVVLFTLALVQSGPRLDGEACDIALQVLKDLRFENGGTIAVSPETARRDAMTRSEAERFAAHTRANNQLDAESERLLDLMVKETDVRAFNPVEECVAIRQWLKASRLVHDPEQIDAAIAGKEQYPFTIIGISMPVVSNDRNHAQMWITEYDGPLGGGGDIVSLRRRDDGRWTIVKRYGMWIS